MDIEMAIRELESRYPQLHRGKQAQPGHPAYERGRGLTFHLCHCAHDDPKYGVWEFAAVGPRGGGYYVGVYLRGGIISVGPKGYHWQKGTTVCSGECGTDQFSNLRGTGILPVAEKHGQDARATQNGVAQVKQLVDPGVIDASMNGDILEIWKAIKETLWDMGNDAVADGQPYGLRGYADWHRKKFPGSFGRTRWEEPITDGLAKELRSRKIGKKRIHARTEKTYPGSSQRCDLVIALDGTDFVWVEVKTAYKECLSQEGKGYHWDGDKFYEPNGKRSWEAGVADIGDKDIKKLLGLIGLQPPITRYIGILLLGFDRTYTPELGKNEITVEQLYGRAGHAGLLPRELCCDGGWTPAHGNGHLEGIAPWRDRYGPRAEKGFRERLWFWYRRGCTDKKG